MKALWTIALLVVVTGIIALFIFSRAKENKAEKETTEFVTDTVNAISENWNARELKKRAEPGLIKAMASQGQSVEQLFGVYRTLGEPVSPPDCKLKDTSQFGANTSYHTASYTCDAQYEKGIATLLITVRRQEDESDWKVYYINISSPYFDRQH